MVDECHATGFMGDNGRGTPEYCGVDVDIINSTLGKALGGASGGCVFFFWGGGCARVRVIDMPEVNHRA